MESSRAYQFRAYQFRAYQFRAYQFRAYQFPAYQFPAYQFPAYQFIFNRAQILRVPQLIPSVGSGSGGALAKPYLTA